MTKVKSNLLYRFLSWRVSKVLFTQILTLYLISSSISGYSQEAYAVFSEDGTLTFYYDSNKPESALYLPSELYFWPEYVRESVTKAVFHKSFADYKPTSCCRWFEGLSNLTVISGMKEYLNTSSVKDMRSMFSHCSSLTSLDLSNFNTKNVTDMMWMFLYCSRLQTIFVGDKWNTSSAKHFSAEMFYGCEVLYGEQGSECMPGKDNIEYAHIDYGATNPGYFTKIGNIPFMPPLPAGIQPYAVYQNGVLTFRNDDKYTDNAFWVTYKWKPYWNSIASNISEVIIEPSFANYKPLRCDWWFEGFKNLTKIQGLEYLNTSNVTDMYGMFSGCSSLTTLDLSKFNTEKVTNMKGMFSFCSNLTTLNLSNFNTENITDMARMFEKCVRLTTLDVSKFNTENATNMSRMFCDCINLTTLDLSNFHTEKVADMCMMFNNCINLTSINLSNFNTNNVTNMGGMFSNCKRLTTLNISNFNTENVSDIGYMFTECSSLETIFVGDKWSTSSTETNRMFTGCTSLIGGKGTTYDEKHTDSSYAHIDGGTDNPGYFTYKAVNSDKQSN